MRRAFIAVVVLGMIVALAISTATATAYPGQAAGQDNSADANALAGNANLTGQNIDQSQSGSGTQVAGQDNSSGQAAEAGAIALQDKPSNTAVGIRVLSPGDDGNVHQSNSADANALAGNLNLTGQNIDQSQGGTAAPVAAPVATPCGCQSGTQVAGQSNSNWQDAGALAVAAQDKPSNTAVGIRVLSPGDDGNVSQSNSADANALAGNANLTGQNIDQSQSGSGTQVAGQDNSSGQAAEAGAIALQDKPSNTAVGIRVLSPGDDGNVHQSNSADANALAGNLNLTGQNIDQSQGGTAAPVRAVATPCGCQSGTQVAGQSNATSRRRAPSASRRSCIHRTPRRRPTSVGGSGCGCEPRAGPASGRQRRASPTASMRTRWQATSTSPARTSTRLPAATTRGAGAAAARSRSRASRTRAGRVRSLPASQHSCIHRTPRRRPTSAAAPDAAASTRARPPRRGRATSTSPTASMQTRWPATSTSPAKHRPGCRRRLLAVRVRR